MVQFVSSNPLVLAVFLFIIMILYSDWATADKYNVVKFGAKGDGHTDSSKAFLNAWAAACESDSPATIYVPGGRYLISNMVFHGCKNHAITFDIRATLLAPSDYRVIGNAENWLSFEDVTGVSIIGGILDGQGIDFWECKMSGKSCPSGATTLRITKSTNIRIRGLISLNSQMFHIVINGCHDVKLERVTVSASRFSPNTDGIHVQLSSDVTMLNIKMRTGDDCVSIGPGTTNVWIENVECGPGHGISIGSLAKDLEEPGVRNVTVTKASFMGSTNGVRIKSWARPSNGFVKGVLFQHIVMVNVQNPILIDQNYCPGNKNCPRQASGIKVRDVTYQDIRGTSATEVAVKLDCSPENPCKGIRLQNIKLTYNKDQGAQSFCANADGMAFGFVQPASCL